MSYPSPVARQQISAGWRVPWAQSPIDGAGLCYEPHLRAQSAGDRALGTCPEGASTAGSSSMSVTAGKNH